MHNYHGENNVFPCSRMNNDFSAHAALLPFMEQAPLFNAINFSVTQIGGGGTWLDPAQVTVTAAAINSYLCPSDPHQYPLPTGWAATNYRANEGTSLVYGYGSTDPSGVNANMPAPNGVFFADLCYGIGSITDGTSNTAAFSEHLTGDFSNAIASAEDTFLPGTFPATPLQAIQQCNAIIPSNLQYQGWSGVGAPWIWGKHSTTVYYHSSLPNSRSCAYPPSRIMTTADSKHPGGVNLLMTDGSVRFVKSSINLTTWWALGTRNGGEVLSASSY